MSAQGSFVGVGDGPFVGVGVGVEVGFAVDVGVLVGEPVRVGVVAVLVRVGVDVGVGVVEGPPVRVAVGEPVGLPVRVTVALGEGDGRGLGVGVGVCEGDGCGVGVADRVGVNVGVGDGGCGVDVHTGTTRSPERSGGGGHGTCWACCAAAVSIAPKRASGRPSARTRAANRRPPSGCAMFVPPSESPKRHLLWRSPAEKGQEAGDNDAFGPCGGGRDLAGYGPGGVPMKNVALPLPALGFIAATRVALGVGIGLLISKRVPRSRRSKLGAALVAAGALTTIPAAVMVFRRRRVGSAADERAA